MRQIHFKEFFGRNYNESSKELEVNLKLTL